MNLERVIELGVAAKEAKEQIEKINKILKENTGFRGINYDDGRFHGVCNFWFGGEKGSDLRKRTQVLIEVFLQSLIMGHEQDIKDIEEELNPSQTS